MTEQIKGLRKLATKLRKIGTIRPGVVLPGADVLLKYARINAPVDTGWLRSSGFSRETDKGADVVFSAEYAAHVEMGTSKAPAQPFLRPAIDEHENEIVEATGQAVMNEIKRLT